MSRKAEERREVNESSANKTDNSKTIGREEKVAAIWADEGIKCSMKLAAGPVVGPSTTETSWNLGGRGLAMKPLARNTHIFREGLGAAVVRYCTWTIMSLRVWTNLWYRN